MTTATPVSPSNTSLPPKKTDDSPPAALNFAFPFKKSDGKDFIDEHQFHALLARESGGFFPVSDSGMWHGGIHVTAGGAGASLDLNNGVRCLADGEVVAYRVDRAYPVSELPTLAGKAAVKATYSTGFALVRHTSEFPRGTKLTFFSLYMHLKSFEEYQKDTSLKMPSYWTKVWKVTPFAKDIPKPDVHHGKAAAGQIGLNIRSAPIGGAPISTSVIGILRQGAQVQIGAQKGSWGQIASIESGGPVIAASVGSFADPKANTGWIFLGKAHGHQLMEAVLSEAHFDQVVVLPKPVKINAGDLIGHLGHYDHLREPSAGNRMVHIEVFCDEKVKPFIEQGRAWVKKNAGTLDPTILRIDRKVKLYAAMGREGADAPQTGVIQIYPLSALAQGPKENQFEETTAGTDGSKFHWWKVDSADVRRAPITGWVREQNHAGGKVTREAACKWVDFEIHEEAHDPMHTMFATPKAYLDYWLDADEPDVPALAKLSPLAGKVYRSVFTTGSGSHAADELRKASRDPWLQLRLSRLIVKHESEWANPGKWKQLQEWIEQRTGHDPAHEEEQKRIAKLVWWDAVTGKIEGFPESADAFHIHPVGLVGNFASGCANECLTEIFEYSLSQGAYRISKDSFSLILSNEGFDPHPNVPANSAASGVTVGYGYDLGQQKPEAIERNLADYYTPQQITKLKTMSGLHGALARESLSDVCDILISEENAKRLALSSMRSYAQQAVNVFPQLINLHPHCQGAMLSLIYNRGSGLHGKSVEEEDRRREMREIKNALEAGS